MHSKLPHVGTTIFTVMSKMAQDYGAINLSQGFPDFDCPPRLRELANFHLNDRRNQYPPMVGIEPLREQIANKVKVHYDYTSDPDLGITVTSGATEALFNAILATVSEGEEVIVFDPAYDSYDPAIKLAGGRAIHLPLSTPEYRIDWNLVEDSLSDRTRLIIINTPHNPAGSTMSAEDMQILSAIAQQRDLYVLSDEVYEHMVFDGRRHESVLRYPDLAERSFAVFSFGKTYHATGWKIAYCVAPAKLSSEFRKVHQFVTFTTTSFLQYALADFMAECPEHAFELSGFYQQKRDYFNQLLASSRFALRPSHGSYFQLADYSEISSLRDSEFVNYLTQEVGVAAIPLSPFYESAPPLTSIRFCFCKDDKTLENAAEILCKL